LAFDTIYAEGQRKYVESLSAYARQFLGQMKKPEVEHIDGLSPAISIDQKTTSKNPRSTVGTVTEIFDYLRLMFARVGTPHCPQCGKEIAQQTVQEIVDQVMRLPKETNITILAPVVKDKKGEHRKILEFLLSDGFTRARIDGEVRELDEAIDLDKNKRHTIEVVADRLTIADEDQQRLADSLETLSCSVTASLSSTSPAPKSSFSVSTSRVPSAASTWEKLSRACSRSTAHWGVSGLPRPRV